MNSGSKPIPAIHVLFRYGRNDAAMSTAAAFGEETWLAGVGGGSGADASENRSGVGC
jgi:hypothetical protein